MKNMELREVQDVLYEILKSFAAFCDEHDLRYFLFGGTLLGAVRHQDFIPWDDDIDVSMPRPDYDRFLALTKESPWENYQVVQSVQPFVKVVDIRTLCIERFLQSKYNIGLFIDIFPIDGLPAEKEIPAHFQTLAKSRIGLIRNVVCLKNYKDGILRFLYRGITWLPSRMVGVQTYWQQINAEARHYPFDTTEQVSVCVWGWDEKDISKKEDLLRRVKLSFRDGEYWCQGDYKKSLTLKYGDYMQLPPESTRVTHGTWFWK